MKTLILDLTIIIRSFGPNSKTFGSPEIYGEEVENRPRSAIAE